MALHPIAQLIIDCFKESGARQAYIDEQTERLSGYTDEMGILMFIALRLDANNLDRLAEKLGLEYEELLALNTVVNRVLEYNTLSKTD